MIRFRSKLKATHLNMNIEELREFCLSFPDTSEDVKWGNDLCFCVKDKMFCVTQLEASPLGLTFKVTPGQFDELVESNGFSSAKYLGRYKWVSLSDVDLIEKDQLLTLITNSYELISKKVK